MKIKSFPKSTKCRGCGARTVRVFVSNDGKLAQYDCPDCGNDDKRRV